MLKKIKSDIPITNYIHCFFFDKSQIISTVKSQQLQNNHYVTKQKILNAQ